MKLWPDVTDYSPSRLFCLDLLRGLDMFFLTVFAPFVNWYVFKVWTPPKWLHLLMNHSETAFAPTATGFGLFDVNNNYGDATDRAIMFHCSAIPGSMLSCKGCIGEHLMFKKAYGPRTGVGIFGGPVREMPLTVGSFKTEDGRLCGFVTEGEVTGDKIEKAFFGTGFVFRKDDNDANGMLNYMSRNGYRHHVAFVKGNWSAAIVEAFSNYLGWEIDRI